jgi:hypothetical protein
MTQVLEALHVANELRYATAFRRARVREPRDTAAGMAGLALELESWEPWPKGLTVAQTLHWPYYSHSWQRQALLRHAGLSETRTVASLTAREVGLLCHALRSPATWKGRA